MNQTTSEQKFLNNQRVLILGGSSGIGLATARAAAREGADVIIVSGNQDRLNNALLQLPTGTQAYNVDLREEANIKTFFAAIGKIDHLVYTAGENLKLDNIDNLDFNNAREYFNIRFWGALAAVKHSMPHISTGGSITLTSGTASRRPMPGWGLGASICAAMEGFTRAMAIEVAPVRVNLVVPGLVRTPLWDSIPKDDLDGLYNSFTDKLPVKHVGEAEEIAQAYIYLMRQTYSTGQCIVVDGGGVLV